MGPLLKYHEGMNEVFLKRSENLFVKEICGKLWKKMEGRVGKLEENVFEGSDLSRSNDSD